VVVFFVLVRYNVYLCSVSHDIYTYVRVGNKGTDDTLIYTTSPGRGDCLNPDC